MQTWFNAINNDICICSYITSQWIFWWFTICTSRWQSMDTTNACIHIFSTIICMWYRIFHQFYCNLLSCIEGNSIWYNGGSHMYLLICNITIKFNWNGSWTKFKWSTRSSMPCKCCTTAHSREKMVYGTSCDYFARRCSTIWFNIHRNVFCIYIVLGVQNLLRLWFYVIGIFHFDCCYSMRNNRLYLFPIKCRRLSMAVDEFLIGCINCYLRLHLFILLFLLQNKVS